MGTAVPPRRPASPRLGNFSKVFELYLKIAPEGDCRDDETTTTLLSTPRNLALVPYKSGLLCGLDLSAIDTPSSPVYSPFSDSSQDTPDSTKHSASSLSDTLSTPASTPPLPCEDPSRSRLSATAKPFDAGFIALVDGYGGSSRGPSLPAYLPTYLLEAARFYKFAPQASGEGSVPPRYVSDRHSKLALLETRLFPQYQLDGIIRVTCGAPAVLPIHIFVDLSNITIGFYDRLKLNCGISVQRKMKASPFFFEGLARILERGRVAARKIIAGSTVDNADRAKWPQYMREAELCGYEMNILNRVTKTVSPPKRRTRRGNLSGSGWATSDPTSSDDTFSPGLQRQGEQAVDEILHLKMCQSVLDYEPSTIVLATGDAAEAEFSDGFLKNVERALRRGWCVELLSWQRGVSSSWRSLQRNPDWAARFRIIELDEFADELLAAFIEQ